MLCITSVSWRTTATTFNQLENAVHNKNQLDDTVQSIIHRLDDAVQSIIHRLDDAVQSIIHRLEDTVQYINQLYNTLI
jgi:hypothetical protein